MVAKAGGINRDGAGLAALKRRPQPVVGPAQS